MKNLKFLFLSLLVSTTVLVSCSKDDDAAPAGSHKVLFVAETSAGATINAVSYTTASGDQTNNTSINAASFNSGELTVGAGVRNLIFVATGRGTDNSSINAKIYVDGQLVKENSSVGSVLSVGTNFTIQ